MSNTCTERRKKGKSETITGIRFAVCPPPLGCIIHRFLLAWLLCKVIRLNVNTYRGMFPSCPRVTRSDRSLSVRLDLLAKSSRLFIIQSIKERAHAHVCPFETIWCAIVVLLAQSIGRMGHVLYSQCLNMGGCQSAEMGGFFVVHGIEEAESAPGKSIAIS